MRLIVEQVAWVEWKYGGYTKLCIFSIVKAAVTFGLCELSIFQLFISTFLKSSIKVNSTNNTLEISATHTNTQQLTGSTTIFFSPRAGSMAGEGFTDLCINLVFKKTGEITVIIVNTQKLTTVRSPTICDAGKITGNSICVSISSLRWTCSTQQFPLEEHYYKQLSYFYVNSCFTGDKTVMINSSHFLTLDEKNSTP